MNRQDLEQYRNVKLEIDDLRSRISRTENDIEHLLEIGVVRDRVYGGEGGIQGFNIEGYPAGIYKKRLQYLRTLQYKLVEKETELTAKAIEVVDFMNTIPLSRDRRIISMIYLDGMTQEAVARKMYLDPSSVSKIVSKCLKDSCNS